MKTVVFSAPFLTQSGYGIHSRQIARWLLSRPDIDVKMIPVSWGNTPWLINPSSQDGFIGKMMEHTVNPGDVKGADVSIQLKLPNEWDPKMAAYNIGITAGVETDRCNPQWIYACNAMNQVIVPSNHVKSSFSNTPGLLTRMDVIPESYIDAVTLPDDKLPQLPQFSTSFNFLMFGQITGNNPHNDRKNIYFTIKWICEAFKDDKDVGIVLKTNMGRNTKIDRKMTHSVIEGVLRECRKGQFPRVHLIHGDIDDLEVAALYRHPQIKSFVTLTRGEGYGLPTLEAAASGLPIIATGWSGHLDFLSLGKYINVFYQLADIHPSRVDNKIFMQNARWANVSENDFKKKITKFRSSSSIPKEWATSAAQILREQYSFESIARQYNELLKDVL